MSQMTDVPLPFTGDPDRSCPWCGVEEVNDFVLQINHWPTSPRSYSRRECIAQELQRTHLQTARTHHTTTRGGAR